MKKIKRTITIEVEEGVWKTLDKYGYHYEKNFEEQLKEVAFIIWNEEAMKNEDDIGTATAKEVRKQNGEY